MSFKPEPQEGKTWKEVNKEHYDAMPEDGFDVPWVRALHKDIIDFLTENHEWVGIPASASFDAGTGIRVLDYACGTGVLSIALASFASQLRGLDISTTMVERYNKAATKQGLAPERMRAVEVDLLSSDASLTQAVAGDEFFGFQLAFVSLALHHIEQPGSVVQALADRVAPGGTVLVIDFQTPKDNVFLNWAETAEKPGHDHSHGDSEKQIPPGGHTVAHRGFSEKQMLDLFAEAGLEDGEVRLNPKLSDMPLEIGGKQQIFYAVAKKPRA